jgi:hypothetical protein
MGKLASFFKSVGKFAKEAVSVAGVVLESINEAYDEKIAEFREKTDAELEDISRNGTTFDQVFANDVLDERHPERKKASESEQKLLSSTTKAIDDKYDPEPTEYDIFQDTEPHSLEDIVRGLDECSAIMDRLLSETSED